MGSLEVGNEVRVGLGYCSEGEGAAALPSASPTCNTSVLGIPCGTAGLVPKNTPASCFSVSWCQGAGSTHGDLNTWGFLGQATARPERGRVTGRTN